MIKYIACLIVSIIIMGCPEAPQKAKYNPSTTTPINIDGTLGGAARVIDKEAGVVCYIKIGYGGISCIPIQLTNLK